jgi:hypothetical protein
MYPSTRLLKDKMNMRASMVRWVMAAAMAAAVSGCSTTRHRDRAVSWDTVPPAAQEAIQAHTYGGWVDKVEYNTSKRGLVYVANIGAVDGQFSRVIVTPDGKLLRYRTCGKKVSEYADF